MKKQIMVMAFAALNSQGLLASTSAKDLSIQCSLKAVVNEVTDIKFNKGVPAHGRFNGIEPSLSFKASLEIVKQDPGCSVLKDKYQIYLGNLTAYGGIASATEDEAVLITELKNKLVDLKLNQHIGYQTKSGYLPLFPFVHSETLSLSFQSEKIFGTVPLPFDLNWVYQVPKVENLSDIEKLSLAEKATPFIYQTSNWYNSTDQDFLNLFLNLEPQQGILKKSYALLIWKTFKEYKESSPYSKPLLQFHVGGEGSFYGAPLAMKLNVISHIPDSFSKAEIVQLLTEIPTWILVGYSNSECLNFSTTDLEDFLEVTHLKLPVLTTLEKSLLKDPIAHISGQVHYVSSCTEGKVSEKSKGLAEEILKVIH